MLAYSCSFWHAEEHLAMVIGSWSALVTNYNSALIALLDH